MDLDCVRLFVLTSEKMDIGAAGRELGMGPAYADTKLADLETDLGVDLLHRSNDRATLSLEGEKFLPFAREMIVQDKAARAALGKGTPAHTGTLRFASSSTFSQLHIAPILPEFMKLHPGITLDLHLSDGRFDLLKSGYDLALRSSAPEDITEDTSLRGHKLADDSRILCAAPGYLAKHGSPKHPDDLADHKLIAFRSQTAKIMAGPGGQTGILSPRSSGCQLILDDGQNLKIATCAGAGISTNSRWSVHRELASGELIHVLPDWTIDDRTILWLVYPKSKILNARVRVFMDFLIDRIGKNPIWLQP